MDEFQDTSETQLRLLRQMVGDWQDGDGRTVFLVGDPMQSIYGFRQADVRGFLRACEQGLGPVRPEVLNLTVNFRLVAATGRAGSTKSSRRVLPGAGRHAQSGTVPYTPCEAAPEPAPEADPEVSGAEWHYFRKGDHESEVAIVERDRARHAGRAPRQDHRGFSFAAGRTARKSAHALSRTDIKVSRTEFDRRGRYSVVQDLAAVAPRAGRSRPTGLPGWPLLRAPWCGLTLADLHLLCHDEPAKTIHELLADPEQVARLSGDGQAGPPGARHSGTGERAVAEGPTGFPQLGGRNLAGAWRTRQATATRMRCATLPNSFDSLAEVSAGSLIDDAVSRTLALADKVREQPRKPALSSRS